VHGLMLIPMRFAFALWWSDGAQRAAGQTVGSLSGAMPRRTGRMWAIQWTGCKSDRSVHPAELRVIDYGKGKILLGDFGPGHLPGAHEYGPMMEALVLNFIEWAKQN
jgi:hypothetical protein